MMNDWKENLAEYWADHSAPPGSLKGATLYKAMTPKQLIEYVRLMGLERARAMRTLSEAMEKQGNSELAFRLNRGALSIQQQFNSFLYSLQTPADRAAIPEFISLFLGTGFLSASQAITLLEAYDNGELKCFCHECLNGEISND